MSVPKLIDSLENGTALDRIRASYNGKKMSVELSDADKEYAEKLAQIRDWWISVKSDTATESMIMEAYKLKDRRKAWELLQDAKTLWALSQKFDPVVELAVFKLWIDRTLELGEKSGDGKMLKAGLDATEKYIAMQLKFAERNRQVSFTVNITFHTDISEFMSKEEYEEAKIEMEEIKAKARKRFKNFDDAEYVEV